MSIILADEQVYTLTEFLPNIHESMCKGEEEPVINYERGSFRLNTSRRLRGLAGMYLGSKYICLPPLDLHYLRESFMLCSNNCAITYLLCQTC